MQKVMLTLGLSAATVTGLGFLALLVANFMLNPN